MIAGLQKMTLLDFPGKVACTVFLQSCNFRCPFCHNSDLLPCSGQKLMDVPAFLQFLKTRQGLLDAVCVSGGEPTLQPELENLLREIKSLGFAVKLDTNGSRPDILKHLVAEGLLDYVAMDVKNSPDRYGQTTGLTKPPMQDIEESLRFLLSDAVPYELRTTVVKEFHDDTSILEMGQWLAALAVPQKANILYLQSFEDRDSVLFSGLSSPEQADLDRYVTLLTPYVVQARLRNG